ncbi:5-oxoprolinase subunit PxpB [Colwellia piezophila]|uniref:5-oxoprolinase subunit PxpB n=1 Tax=Colwellia piezophila TaxID=211668 RepID=UPI0003691511|nr:5-oxoprolinase subunit PxpB [Colwellia piezophila]
MSTIINESIRLEIAGENALMLYFSDKTQASITLESVISAEINSNVHQAVQLIRTHLSVEVIDLIPSYASILVVFNLLEIDHQHLSNRLKYLLKTCGSGGNKPGKLIELPVYYSLASGIDLTRIAKQAKISVEQVIALHQKPEYRVYAIGFAPGFAYLGEVDQRIAMPRLTSPRLKVPKGAVAIADRQTAVYPAESPGGWNIIGLCPVDMFNAQTDPVMRLSVGDRVTFVAIEKSEFLTLGGVLPCL